MNRIDELDLVTIDGITCCKGHPMPFGGTLLGSDRINFSINSADAESCSLQLYHSGEKEPFADIPIPEAFRIGNNYSILVFGQNPEELEYTYRFNGRYDPASGYRFDPRICLLDPYAKLLSGRETWGRKRNEAAPLRGKIIQEDFPWEGDRALEIPFEDLVIYETHVRPRFTGK